jgi:hypothetical protein
VRDEVAGKFLTGGDPSTSKTGKTAQGLPGGQGNAGARSVALAVNGGMFGIIWLPSFAAGASRDLNEKKGALDGQHPRGMMITGRARPTMSAAICAL